MPAISKSHRRFVAAVSFAYAIFWVLLAIDPSYRDDWALENVMVAAAILLLAVSWRWYVFSKTSYLLIAIFLSLHAIGSHYTYSEVPYDAFFQNLTGRTLNGIFGWERNHFDRWVHFLFGLLILFPLREAFLHFARVKWPFWSYLIPIALILATSLAYELLEWAAASVFGGDLGMAFLGTQGDVWDSQKDSFLALIGALIATAVIAVKHFATGRDWALEWVDRQRAG